MLFSRILIILAISAPCLGAVSTSKEHKAKTELTAKHSKSSVKETKTKAFLLATRKALKENGLSVPSEDDIKKIIKKQLEENENYEDEVVNKEFCLLTDSFLSFTQKVLKKNDTSSSKFKISISNASFVEEFFLGLLPKMATVAHIVGYSEIEGIFHQALLEHASPSSIASLYQSFFSQNPIDFTPICALCKQQGLIIPQNPKEPTEFVHSMLQLNMTQEGVLKMTKLSSNQQLFTKWMVLSIQTDIRTSATAMQFYMLGLFDYLGDLLGSKERKEMLALLEELKIAASVEDQYEVAQVATLGSLLSLIYEQ